MAASIQYVTTAFPLVRYGTDARKFNAKAFSFELTELAGVPGIKITKRVRPHEWEWIALVSCSPTFAETGEPSKPKPAPKKPAKKATKKPKKKPTEKAVEPEGERPDPAPSAPPMDDEAQRAHDEERARFHAELEGEDDEGDGPIDL